MKIKLVFLLLLGQVINAKANVVPNSLFSNHAILQRNVFVPVWGTARNGEKVSVKFAGQQVETIAANGNWMVKLKPLQAGGPFTMIIKGDNEVTVNDILVGEVWVVSGQSNMGVRVIPEIVNGAQEIANANYPEIRQYFVPKRSIQDNLEDVGGTWTLCTPENVTNFSAVGYFFVRDLYKKMNVPFGMLATFYGGTPAEYWTSQEALNSDPEFNKVIAAYRQSLTDYPAKLAQFTVREPALLEKYRLDTAKARGENKPLPQKPMPPKHPSLTGAAGGLYYAMIEPLQPYAVKGVIWYQGETNSDRGKEYQKLFPLMISDWRKDWKQGDFPFLFVQIAPHKDMSPEIREAQLLTWKKTPNTSMVVTTDCGNAFDLHPNWKQPVGARLALAANALAYQEKIEYAGPLYQKVIFKEGRAVLSFTHAKKLIAKGGALKGFMIAGADKNFVQAKAEIVGKNIVVYNPSITSPKYVRFGWANVPDVNLYNEADLPASPFRTDTD